MSALFMVVWILSTVWVYVDAKEIGARKGLIKGFFDVGPGAWSACVFLLWIIAFPLYLWKRGSIKQAAKDHSTVELARHF